MDRTVTEDERHAGSVRAGCRVGVEHAGRVGPSVPGVAHEQRYLGAEIARVLEEGVQRAGRPTGPGAIRKPYCTVADEESIAQPIGYVGDSVALCGANEGTGVWWRREIV